MIKRNSLRLAAVPLIVLAFVAAPWSRAALVNPGFETGTAVGNGDVYGAAGWNVFGNVYNVSSPNPAPAGPHSGTGAVKMFGTFPGVSGAFQSFPASAGESWTLSGFGLNSSGDPMQPDNFGLLKISFQDAGNNELAGFESPHITISTVQDQWQSLNALGTAPAGTHHVNLFALFVQPATNGGSAAFDDLSGGLVPEPTSLSLLALGGLIALRRRR